jgi:hypothetical protein
MVVVSYRSTVGSSSSKSGSSSRYHLSSTNIATQLQHASITLDLTTRSLGIVSECQVIIGTDLPACPPNRAYSSGVSVTTRVYSVTSGIGGAQVHFGSGQTRAIGESGVYQSLIMAYQSRAERYGALVWGPQQRSKRLSTDQPAQETCQTRRARFRRSVSSVSVGAGLLLNWHSLIHA